MKPKFACLALFFALSASGSTSALAHEDPADGSTHWISHTGSRQPTANELAPYGYVSTGPAERTLQIGPGVKYVNVTRLETIRINIGGTSVVWTFDTLGTPVFSLSEIMPNASGVTVYVDESPLYSGL